MLAGMGEELLPIGEVSRRSGLPVSALRFYDREGVLPAAEVDPGTGYRRYAPEQVRRARLLAGMRRIQLPLAEMVAVLEAGADGETVRDLLDGHVRRLERGVELARAEASRLSALADGEAGRVLASAGPLRAALRDVRYAVATTPDPDHVALGSVLLEWETEAAALRAVATDRYRLALATVGVHQAGSAVGAASLLPGPVADELIAFLPEDGQVRLTLAPTTLRAELTDGPAPRVLNLEALDAAYPDYRMLLSLGGDPGRTLGPEEVREALTSGDAQDAVVSLARGWVVSRSFLQEAVDGVGPQGQLTLPESLGPLVLANEDRSRLALVMPLRPEAS